MRKILISSLLALAAAFNMNGCTHPAEPASLQELEFNIANSEAPHVIRWNNFGEFNSCDAMWYREACRRFKNPVIFRCHGGPCGSYDGTSEWYCYPDPPRRPMKIVDVAKMLHNLYPDRDIVMITCNSGHSSLDVPRVYYATDKVWLAPDFAAIGPWWHETRKNFGDVGTIDEFITGPAPTTRPHTRKVSHE